MTRADLEAFITRHTAAFGRHDPAALARDHTIAGVVISPMFATLHGRPAIEESYRATFTAFPDWKVTAEDLIIDPPRVAVLFTVTATHVNEFLGLPGSGKAFELRGVQYMEIDGGLIAHERRVYDFTGWLVDVGILRARRAQGVARQP